MLKGTGWDVPAHILQTAFLNAGDVQAEGTTERGQACLYSLYSTTCYSGWAGGPLLCPSGSTLPFLRSARQQSI